MAPEPDEELNPGLGPVPRTVSSVTQYELSVAEKLLSKIRRGVSHTTDARAYATGIVGDEASWYSKTLTLPDGDFSTLEKLKKAVFEVICGRLQAQQVPTQTITRQKLAWCLPVK